MKHSLNDNNIYELKKVLLEECLVFTVDDSDIEDCLCDYIYDYSDVKEYLVDLHDINDAIINYIDFDGLIDESSFVEIGDDRYLELNYILEDSIDLIKKRTLRDIREKPVKVEFDFVDYADLINKHEKDINELKKQVQKLNTKRSYESTIKFPKKYKLKYPFNKYEPEDLK